MLRNSRPWAVALALVVAAGVVVLAAPLIAGNIGWLLVLRDQATPTSTRPYNPTAVAAFGAAAALRPGWARPLVGSSFADPDAGAARLDQAMRDDPAFEPGWLLLSRAEEARGDTARADALLISTRSVPLLARVGDRLVRAAATGRAAALYRAALDVEPGAWYPAVQLSSLELRDPARRDEAVQRLETLLQASPTLVPALVLRAQAAIDVRDWPTADAFLSRAQTLEPDNGDAHLARARLLRDGRGDPDAALVELARARDASADDGWIDVTIGETGLVSGRAEMARDVLEPLCGRGGDAGAHACYLLADYYLKTGDRARAEPLAARATALASNPAYAALLRRVRDSA